jgi:hypothetical protein
MRGQYSIINSKKNTRKENPGRISAAGVSWDDVAGAKNGDRRPINA